VLYLAIRNAPTRFSGDYMHEYFAALNLLQSTSLARNASRRLREAVKTLENATCSLARGPIPMPILARGNEARLELFPTQMSIADCGATGTWDEVDLVEKSNGRSTDSEHFSIVPRHHLLGIEGSVSDAVEEADDFRDLWAISDDDCWQSPSGGFSHEPVMSQAGLYNGNYWSENTL
jgi:hypothetical protein